jgi:hypothetical protein
MSANNNTENFIQAGDIVWGRPVVEGKKLARRKGIVLGTFADDSDRLIVWWTTLDVEGPADASTLMFRSELTKAGDIFGFGSKKSLSLANKLDGYGRARFVRNLLASHGYRMRSIGA